MPGRKKGQAAPPSDKGLKTFEFAQFNVFTSDVKKRRGGAFPVHLHVLGGHGTDGYGVCWGDLGVVPDQVEDYGEWGFDPSADNRGAYAGLVHGIASHPKSKPKTPAAPEPGNPCSRIAPTPEMPSPRPWAQSPPPSTCKAGYGVCVLVFIYGSVLALM